MIKKISRRSFIQVSLASSTLLITPWSKSVLAQINNPLTSTIFSHGVASGDPTHNSVIIWTRISPSKIAQQIHIVKWQISTDIGFKNRITQGYTQAEIENDFTLKIDVTDLQPGKHYYYRFIYNDVVSETGRTRTLPMGSLNSLCLAVLSCSSYPFGYFNAYKAIASDPDIDFVVHLGNYLYEHGRDGYGGKTGKKIKRNHIPSHEIITLSDYRERHAQYKSDTASRLMHATHPIITIWDDHETANNAYQYGAQNHQSKIEGNWLDRRNASIHAYYEWMPIRRPDKQHNQRQFWRAFQFGNLATMITLETRHTGRDKQVNYTTHLPTIKSDRDRSRFINNILGDTHRSMLSDEMELFLNKHISTSQKQNQPWRLIGNQIPMARIHTPYINRLLKNYKISSNDPRSAERRQFKRLGELDLPLYTDTWDGYAAAREQFYAISKLNNVNDLLVLTGNSNSFWANILYDNKGKNMGLELGTAGITSPGDFEGYGKRDAQNIDRLLIAHNKEVAWTDGLHRGFIKLTLHNNRADVEYVAVSTVHSENYKVSTLKKIAIKRYNNILQYVNF